MIFHHLTASFGALTGQTLRLKDGLNLIEAPNESGKSTWCAFLRTMLYGINTRERDSKTALADKNRYLPWSGAPMEGELSLTWQGRNIILRRSSRSAAFDTFSAVDAATGEPVPGLSGESAGQTLLGVGREVYERSAFVRQGGASALDGSAELERRIAALVSSGDEEVAFSEVRARLKEWQRRRKFNQTGLIPKLEGELREVEEQLEQLSAFSGQATAAMEREKVLSAEAESVKAALVQWDALDRQEQNRRYTSYKAKWDEAFLQAESLRNELEYAGPLPDEAELRKGLEYFSQLSALDEQERSAAANARAAEEEAQASQSDAGLLCFLGMTPEEAWERADEDAADVLAHHDAAAQGGKGAVAGVIAGLAAGVGLSFALLHFTTLLLPVCIGAGCSLFVLVALISVLAGRSVRRRHQEEKEAIFEHYGVHSANEIRALAADYREKQAVAQQAGSAAVAAREKAEALQLRCAALQNELLSLVRPFAPKARTAADANDAIRGALTLRTKLTEAEEKRDNAKHIFDLVAEQGGEAVSGEPVSEPEQSREELTERLQAIESDLSKVRELLSAAKGGQAALGDDAALRAQREQLTEALRARREENDALTLAVNALETANEAFRARISPALNRRCGELFSQLTGGAYDAVTLSRTFDAQARPAGTVLPRGVLSLSAGTADQLYLAARLAVCELVFPPGEPVPLVLDDALCNFDDERMSLALQTLLKLAEERQILLFTCHRRERQWLEQAGASCNFPERAL